MCACRAPDGQAEVLTPAGSMPTNLLSATDAPGGLGATVHNKGPKTPEEATAAGRSISGMDFATSATAAQHGVRAEMGGDGNGDEVAVLACEAKPGDVCLQSMRSLQVTTSRSTDRESRGVDSGCSAGLCFCIGTRLSCCALRRACFLRLLLLEEPFLPTELLWLMSLQEVS